MKAKNVFILLSLSLLFACQSNKAETQNPNSESNLAENIAVIGTSLLKGIWWESVDAPVATFVIKDSTVYYPDQEVALSEFKYSLINDSLKIFKPNMPVIEYSENETIETVKDMSEAYKIVKITKDTLVLSSEFGVSTFIKIQE